jgi:uncharacterized protein (DUF1684 family)
MKMGERQAAMSAERKTAEEREPTWLDLYDWRARVAALYAERAAAWRRGEDAREVLGRFRAAKDALFARHPQSPLGAAARAGFVGLPYFDYDAAWAVEAELTLEPAATGDDEELPASGPHSMRFPRAGRARFTLGGQAVELVVYWIDVYGGGLFLPFRDATCPAESYGGGRYLFDTVKGSEFLRLDSPAGADEMGYAGGHVLLDFNYAYNPSCAYDARWTCPLAPNENRLPIAIRAGERKYE